MQRLKVILRPEAQIDLQDIYRVIFRVSLSEVTATRFTKRIIDRARRIGDIPRGCRPRNDLEPGLRTVAFKHSAVIAYKVEFDCVRITNIFYGGRDFEAFYRDGDTQE